MRLSLLRRAPVLMLVVVAAVATAGGVLASTAGRDEHPKAHVSWNGFGVDNWPDHTWRPYGPNSPFNRPIPADANVHPRSEAIVRRLLAFGRPAPIVAGSSGTEDDYGHPTYYARRSDPRYVLHPTRPWPQDVRRKTIHVPRQAQWAPGSDGHMTVVQPDGWEYDFWQVQHKPRNGGTLRFSAGGRLRIGGSGLGSIATASNFGTLAGIVRAPELEAGNIDHALFVVVSCLDRSHRFGYGVRLPENPRVSGYVRPASGGGSVCPSGIRHAPPMGARLQLAMEPEEIDALGLPPWKSAIMHAFARYGAYIGDTGGPGFAVMIESSLTYTAYGRPDPLLEFGRAAHESGDPHVTEHDGRYVMDLAGGVDWQRHLRVVTPPPR